MDARRMRKHGRRDKNHREVVQALRALHWKVADTADVGGGFGDLVIQRGHDTRIIEIKSRTGKLTDDQRRFIERDGWRVQIVRSVEDALSL